MTFRTPAGVEYRLIRHHDRYGTSYTVVVVDIEGARIRRNATGAYAWQARHGEQLCYGRTRREVADTAARWLVET